MSEKLSQSEICIVINNKTQGSVAKHLRNDDVLYYFLKVVNIWQSYMQNG